MNPTWVTAFLDLPADDFDAGVHFWRSVTGYGLSAARGERAEFATLVPPAGDGFLKVQRLGSGPSRIHLDLHAPGQEFAVHTSPGGFVFCRVSHPASSRPAPAVWPSGHRSLVDQVCLDIPADRYDEECAFWQQTTGWVLRQVSREFQVLVRPEGMPIRLLLQLLDEETGPVRAHLDLAADDRAAEVGRHEQLGASVLAVHDHWSVLRDPTGSTYCVTDRNPESGLIG
jgi:hypothetical protein